MFLPRKTEFMRTGLLSTDQKVSGSNPLGRVFRRLDQIAYGKTPKRENVRDLF
jgi:hypothetical protein